MIGELPAMILKRVATRMRVISQALDEGNAVQIALRVLSGTESGRLPKEKRIQQRVFPAPLQQKM